MLIALDTGNIIIDGTALPISVIIMFIKNSANASNTPHITSFLFNTGFRSSCEISVALFLHAVNKKLVAINSTESVKIKNENNDH